MELWGHTINSFWKEEKYEKNGTLSKILRRIHWCNNIHMMSWWLFDKLSIWCYLRWFWWMEKGYEYDIIKYDVISLFVLVWFVWAWSEVFFSCIGWALTIFNDLFVLFETWSLSKGYLTPLLIVKAVLFMMTSWVDVFHVSVFVVNWYFLYGSLEDFSLSLFLAAFVVKGI